MRSVYRDAGKNEIALAQARTGNSVTRKFVQPYGIRVNSSNGCVDVTGLSGSMPAASSVQDGTRLPLTCMLAGAPSGENGASPREWDAKVQDASGCSRSIWSA